MSFLEKLKKLGQPRQKKEAEKSKKKEAEVPKDKKEKESKKESKIIEEKWFEPEGELTVDVYQTDEEVIINSAVAGVKTEDLDIAIEDDIIRIKGKREKPNEVEQKNYLVQECYWGPFSKEIVLPFEIDGTKAEASIKEGVLVIKVPKIEKKKKKKVKIKETK